jgi:two-component sensor histidine kinase
VVSRPALQRRVIRGCHPGDYAILNSNHTHDGTAAYSPDKEGRVQISGPKCLLEPTTAQAIAVILHELATNAAKYGALSVSNGHVQVEWCCESGQPLILRWIETDGPPVEPTNHQGFGTRVINNMIRNQLKGELRFDWRIEGLACEIILPPQ